MGERTGSVTVRYWAAARSAAGVVSDTVEAGTLAEVLVAVRTLHRESARFADVSGVCSILVGDEPVGSRPHDEVVVRPGTTVELLPPFAGG